MPGHIAPAYVAVDANTLLTGATAGWFGDCSAMHESAARPSPRWRTVSAPIVRHGAVFSPLCARRARM
jgi:hypothetical protein